MTSLRDHGNAEPANEDDVSMASDSDGYEDQDDNDDEWDGIGVDGKDSEEEELEEVVFGTRKTLIQGLMDDEDDLFAFSTSQGDNAASRRVLDLELAPDSALFEFANESSKGPLTTTATAPDAGAAEESNEAKCVWRRDPEWEQQLVQTRQGETMTRLEFEQRLRDRFRALNPTPKWVLNAPGYKRRRRDGGPDSEGALSAPGSKRRRGDSSGSEDSSSEEEEDEDGNAISAPPLAKLLRDVGHLPNGAAERSQILRPETIDIQRSRDIPVKLPTGVSSICFHPKYPIILTSGTSSMLYLNHIDPTAHPDPNPKLAAVLAKGVDVRRAQFKGPRGDTVYLAGRRGFFHIWHLESSKFRKIPRIFSHEHEHRTMEHFRLSPCGRYMAILASQSKRGKGSRHINVLNADNHQCIGTARLDGKHGIADFAWWKSGDGLSVLGAGGQVAEWGVEQRKTLVIWRDKSFIKATRIALGGRKGPWRYGGDRWVAIGSENGIVAVYDRQSLPRQRKEGGAKDNDKVSGSSSSNIGTTIEAEASMKPNRAFEQLVTSITALTFSPDGQLLAFASYHVKDALRLAHMPSCTVYRNWPTVQTAFGRITAVAFGPSMHLAVGNDAGKVRLWDIRG